MKLFLPEGYTKYNFLKKHLDNGEWLQFGKVRIEKVSLKT